MLHTLAHDQLGLQQKRYGTLFQGIRQSAEQGTEKTISHNRFNGERVNTDGLTSFKALVFFHLLSLLLNKDYRHSCSSNTSTPQKSFKASQKSSEHII